MNTKPFDLQRAVAGKPVVTTYGNQVKQFTHFVGAIIPIRAMVGNALHAFHLDGKQAMGVSMDGGNIPAIGDLRMVDLSEIKWINVYPYLGEDTGVTNFYNNEAAADAGHDSRPNKGAQRLGNKAFEIKFER